MCFYCGCREIPLLRDYIAEHEHITNLGAELTKALCQGGPRWVTRASGGSDRYDGGA
jgi:hypothetical protein